jgi:threonine synthase
VLFPRGRVSDVQRGMMTTAPDANVHAIAIDGTFDDCQALVKGLFNHHAFRDRVRLSGVNSINWARIVAQVVYYFTAAATLGAPYRKVAFTVPTGNFGDIFAGYVAARMGLPVDRLVIATNVNDILVRTLATGSYELRDVVATASPSMDIQVSSNFERLLFEATGRDATEVRRLMAQLTQSRRFSLSSRALEQIRALFSADRADEEETAATIRTTLRETSRLVDPHTAVGLAVAEKEEARDPAVPMIVLGTAHAAKFPEAVEAACGVRPGLPDWLSDLPQRAERSTPMAVDQGALEKFIMAASRAAREGAAA